MSNRKSQSVRVREAKSRRILNAGANRGARANVSAFEEHNRNTTAGAITPLYADPVPGRAGEMVETADRLGVSAEATEGRAEDVLADAAVEGVVVNVDDPGTVARIINTSTRQKLPALGYLGILLPDDRLLGVRFALPSETATTRSTREVNSAVRDEVHAFFEGLAKVTAPGGSNEIFGARAESRHRLIEPLLRKSFSDHARTELSRLVAGVAPEHAPLEVTFDGQRVHTLHVVARDTFGDSEEIAARLLENPRVPVRRGTTFFVAQVTPKGIRLDEARFRSTDGALAVRETAAFGEALARRLTPTTNSPLVRAVREHVPQVSATSSFLGALALGFFAQAAMRAASSAVEPVRTDTLTALSPVLTTD